MIEFGYKISPDRQMDYDLNPKRVLDYIRSEEKTIDGCMSCGTCSSACTAAHTSDYSLRRLILLARRGEEKEIKEMVFRCRLCGKCMIACPRNVNTRNIIYLMQKAIVKFCENEV
jgi:heterodisulfide reductase subunit C